MTVKKTIEKGREWTRIGKKRSERGEGRGERGERGEGREEEGRGGKSSLRQRR